MKHAVTGAFGYSGSYITRRLLAAGAEVRTLTNTPRKPDSPNIPVYPLTFGDSLVDSLYGVDVLYNTYWVRFNHEQFNHQSAVENTLKLFAAAKIAGVKRIVHVSITNPDEHSPFEYFRGKGVLERALIESGLSYAILRPAVLFGGADVLINNIAWLLRHLPVFGVFGDGGYRLQPIHVDDMACLAIEQAYHRENVIVNALGPETFTYLDLVTTLRDILGLHRPLLHVSPEIGYQAGKLIGALMDDVTITREEIGGLIADLLCVDAPPTGSTHLTEWARAQRETLGTRYASELARR